MATMAGTPREGLGPQAHFPNSPVGRDGSRPLFIRYECFGQRHRLPYCAGGFGQPEVASFSRGRMARGLSRELTAWEDGPNHKRHWRSLFDVALPDWNHSVVARRGELASQPERELEVEFRPA